jgi:NAD(P)-dependent dehydrogenase (short-subunit alcohol dehydrogenase family)
VKLKGEVAVITGSGRGIGRAAAIDMAKEGASVVILSRTASDLKETAKIIKASGGRVISHRADVSNPRDVENVVHKTMTGFGKIDILMNNAAIVGPVAHFFRVNEEDWDSALDINLKGVYLFSRAVIPHMIEQGRGKIINLTSGLGEMVMPPFGVYSVTKAGLIHLTRIMAEELKGFNIQVNGLDPGVADTSMQEGLRRMGPGILGKEIYSEFVSMKKKGLLQPPERAAHLAVFLASKESDKVTGKNGTGGFYTRYGFRG